MNSYEQVLMVTICILGGILAGTITGFMVFNHWRSKHMGRLMYYTFIKETLPDVTQDMLVMMKRVCAEAASNASTISNIMDHIVDAMAEEACKEANKAYQENVKTFSKNTNKEEDK